MRPVKAVRAQGFLGATSTSCVLGLLLLLVTSSCSSSAPRSDLRVVVVSDMNGSYGSTVYEPEVHRAIGLIRDEWHPDLVLSAGDMIAGQKPTLSDEEVRDMWAAFDSVVAMPLRRADIPFGFTIGNHDGSGHPLHRRDRDLARAHWRAPEHDPGVSFIDSTYFPFYYSFMEGEVYVLVWDASYGGTVEDSTMMEWVISELGRESAREARHRIVLGHLPLYGIAEGRNRSGEVLHEADSLRRLLKSYDVHTYISGHHHAYYPGRRGGVELLYSGAAGQGPRSLIGSDDSPVQTVTLLDFDFATDSVAYTTYGFENGEMRIIETAELPPAVRGFNGYVIRRDLPDSAAIHLDSKSTE